MPRPCLGSAQSAQVYQPSPKLYCYGSTATGSSQFSATPVSNNL